VQGLRAGEVDRRLRSRREPPLGGLRDPQGGDATTSGQPPVPVATPTCSNAPDSMAPRPKRTARPW
jgi:hypothetical protein